ncbi:E3 ubiquitin-protein ligase HERC2 [Hondaea fermentalgiana]|uniref:E3 ubiquitin-protein ligase HERC2 n=1 Tax=Hondaea fermentalgiana TaxID=2315210 RepID=A0A2R5GR57_9STRA|nr:E3 ubiquitin-protein ligase HERC2 [Hondaea fermentalgiana]|eukprot:GBG33367.1 E3 ubiquitin-protein ligase HERC2 [Hondaea fermentalgiana]
MDKYGTHGGITGFRFKCKNCPNHDLCESCYNQFNEQGELKQDASMARVNKVSTNPEDHEFYKHAETDTSFVPIGGAKKEAKAPVQAVKKVKPNEPCTCNSGKKYKKCCGKPGAAPPAAASGSA